MNLLLKSCYNCNSEMWSTHSFEYFPNNPNPFNRIFVLLMIIILLAPLINLPEEVVSYAIGICFENLRLEVKAYHKK